jgi:hypothetical protein
MKLRFPILTLIVLIGCSKPKDIENQSTTIGKVDAEIQTLVGNDKDTLSYVGFIGKFEDNNTFYTDLYFMDDFNYDLYSKITKMGDQVVFKEDDVTRTKLEIKDAGQYFNLTGLKSIDIYDHKSQKLTTGQLSHIEYFEDVIEGRFVAVFNVADPNISEYLFCVGNTNVDLTKMEFSIYDDENLKSKLTDFLKINSDNVWEIKHYKLDNESIYSTVSTDTTAYVIETMDGNHKTLYKSRSSEVINGLSAISKKLNGRPILLTESGMPETDMLWTSVLIFNGTEYETSRDHRVN